MTPINLSLNKKESGAAGNKTPLAVGRGFKIALIIFGVLALGAGLAVGYFALAKANINIVLQPASYTAQTTYTFLSNSASDDAPGRILELKLNKTITASSSFDTEPSAKAGGMLKVTNKSKTPQTLIATTRFLSADGKLFRATKTIEVGASSTAEIMVEADKEGANNVGPAGRYTIPGLAKGRQAEVYADALSPLTQNSLKISKVTESDMEKAKKEIQSSLTKELLSAFKGQLKFGEEVRTESIISQITAFSAKAKVGDKVTEFEATGELLARAVAVLPAKLNERMTNLLKQNADQEAREFISLNPSSIRLTLATDSADPVKLVATMVAQGLTYMTQANPALAKEKMMGRSPDELKNYLATFADIQDQQIELTPFWVKRVPTFEGNINLKISKIEAVTPEIK